MSHGLKVGNKLNIFIYLDRLMRQVDSKVEEQNRALKPNADLIEFQTNLRALERLLHADWTGNGKEKEIMLYLFRYGMAATTQRYGMSKPTLYKMIRDCEVAFIDFIGVERIIALKNADVKEFNRLVTVGETAKTGKLFLSEYRGYLPKPSNGDLSSCVSELRFLRNISLPYVLRQLQLLNQNKLAALLALLTSADAQVQEDRLAVVAYLQEGDEDKASRKLDAIMLRFSKK